MKITQVSSEYVLEHKNADNIYRIRLNENPLLQIWSVNDMNVYVLIESINDPDCGFILIEGDNNAI